MSETPEHRAAMTARSGDDHVIGDDGELRNVEQEARDRAAAAEAAEQGRKPRKAADPTPAGD